MDSNKTCLTLSNNQQIENQERERRGGEVDFFVHKDTNFHRISGFTSDQHQLLTIKLSIKKYSIICPVVHLSPGLRQIDSLKSLEKYLDGIDIRPDDDLWRLQSWSFKTSN